MTDKEFCSNCPISVITQRILLFSISTAKVQLISPPEEDGSTINTMYYPDFYITVDHDDITPSPNTETMLQYSKVKQGVLTG